MLVNSAYLCLNHCLEQLIRFCDEALFFDQDEEQAVRRVYRKFGYPIVPTPIETSQLLKFFSTNVAKKIDENDTELALTAESTTLEKVQFYIFHLKILLKTSDQQNVSTVSDLDDALLQFSSFISNGEKSSIEVERRISFHDLQSTRRKRRCRRTASPRPS